MTARSSSAARTTNCSAAKGFYYDLYMSQFRREGEEMDTFFAPAD